MLRSILRELKSLRQRINQSEFCIIIEKLKNILRIIIGTALEIIGIDAQLT
jgi:hypothetical protein